MAEKNKTAQISIYVEGEGCVVTFYNVPKKVARSIETMLQATRHGGCDIGLSVNGVKEKDDRKE